MFLLLANNLEQNGYKLNVAMQAGIVINTVTIIKTFIGIL